MAVASSKHCRKSLSTRNAVIDDQSKQKISAKAQWQWKVTKIRTQVPDLDCDATSLLQVRCCKKILKKCIKKQNVESAKKYKKNCGRCLQRVIKFFFETKRSKPKRCWQKNGVVESRFPVWHYAFGLSYREISATEFNCVRQQRTWQRWGHVDASKAKNANARNIRDEAW